MNNINTDIKKLNSLDINNLDDRIKLIKKLNLNILKERTNYEKLLNNFENCKESKKFSNKTLNELLKLFETSTLNDQIKIYKSFSIKIDSITKELFTSLNTNEQEENYVVSDHSDDSDDSDHSDDSNN